MNKITPTERKVLNYIKKYYIKHGVPPTIRQICTGLKYSSTSSVWTIMDRLDFKGAIKKMGKYYTVTGVKISFDEPEKK